MLMPHKIRSELWVKCITHIHVNFGISKVYLVLEMCQETTFNETLAISYLEQNSFTNPYQFLKFMKNMAHFCFCFARIKMPLFSSPPMRINNPNFMSLLLAPLYVFTKLLPLWDVDGLTLSWAYRCTLNYYPNSSKMILWGNFWNYAVGKLIPMRILASFFTPRPSSVTSLHSLMQN